MSQQPLPDPVPCPTCWHPDLNTSWQWQLTGTVDQSIDVVMYDIDMFGNDETVVQALHDANRVVIGYINAGAWEPDRPDADQVPESVKGNSLQDFPEERWLDIRDPSVQQLMLARMDLCQSRGYDGVEFDNVDGFNINNNSGFPLTYNDQLAYNIFLANEAHARGLSVALKNDGDQVSDLLPYFDWALVEECFHFQECDAFQPFIDAGKAVMEVEYVEDGADPAVFCPLANGQNFNALLKHKMVDVFRVACR